MSERFPLLKKVSEVMTKNVLTVKPAQNLGEAAKVMEEKNVGSLVVMDRKRIVGIITERDLLKFMAKQYDPRAVVKLRKPWSSITVKEAMSKPVVMCTPDTTVEAALRLMNERQIRHLPVVKDGSLLGIISCRGLDWISVAEITSLFHRLFVSYCKTLGQILKSGAASFTPNFIEELVELFGRKGFKPVEEGLTGALVVAEDTLKSSQLVKEVRFHEVKAEKYRLEIRNCMFAAETHPSPQEAEFTCPLAIVATAILRRVTGRDVTVSFSILSETGSATYLTVK